MTTLPIGQFYGKVVRRVDVPGLRLSEAVYAPGVEIGKHSHEWANFCLVLKGGYSEWIAGAARACEPSSLVFHPAGEVHSDRHGDAEVRIFCVEVEPQKLDSVRHHTAILDRSAEFHGGIASSLCSRLYGEFRQNDDCSPLAMEGLTLEVIAQAARGLSIELTDGSPRWLELADELVRARYDEALSLGEVAQQIGVHPVHLARVFRRRYGCTLGEYVRRLRIEHACKRLANSHLSIGEIAMEASFADQSHFTRTFKVFTGMSPAEYRRSFTRTRS